MRKPAKKAKRRISEPRERGKPQANGNDQAKPLTMPEPTATDGAQSAILKNHFSIKQARGFRLLRGDVPQSQPGTSIARFPINL